MTLELDKKEINLIEFLRQLGYGQVTVFVQDSKPVRIEEGIKSKKL